MRISDWSSDVCSSDLVVRRVHAFCYLAELDPGFVSRLFDGHHAEPTKHHSTLSPLGVAILKQERLGPGAFDLASEAAQFSIPQEDRSEEHTSELQSLMRISYAPFCFNKKHNT